MRERIERSEWLNALALAVGAFALLGLALMLSSCSSKGVVRFRVANETPHKLTFRTSAGVFSRSITLEPGVVWDGWADPRFVSSQIVVSVK
jgi:hypothetical protein